MHRSGTSAITGALGLLGAKLPSKLLGPHPSNPKGHFESTDILAVTEQLLLAVDSAWYDFSSISPAALEGRLAQNFTPELERVLREDYEGALLFTLKDPRFCRLLPIIRLAIENSSAAVRTILCFRNHLEVAHSLKARDGISLAHGLSLWLRYMLDSERHSRGMPRVFVQYPQFVTNWRRAVDRIQEALQISFPKQETAASEVDQFLDSDLRHHSATIKKLKQNFRHFDWFADCLKCFDELTRDPNDHRAMNKLDIIRSSFEQHADFFGPPLKDYYAERLRLQHELNQTLAQNKADIAQNKADLAQIRADLQQQTEWLKLHLTQTEADLARTRADLQTTENHLLSRNKEVSDLSVELLTAKERGLRLEQKIRALTSKTSELNKQLRRILNSSSWRGTAPFRAVVNYARRLRVRHHWTQDGKEQP
jgi:hypothetical protein